jgi:hypothetical protein
LERNIAFLQEYFVDPRLKAGIDASALTEGLQETLAYARGNGKRR